MKRIFWITLISLVFLFSIALAYPSYLRDFNDRYQTAGTVLDDCGTCHGATTGVMNPYGQSLVDSLAIYPIIDSALVHIENIDSDGDGVTNIKEIMARSHPGDNTDTTPAEGQTWGALKQMFQ